MLANSFSFFKIIDSKSKAFLTLQLIYCKVKLIKTTDIYFSLLFSLEGKLMVGMPY